MVWLAKANGYRTPGLKMAPKAFTTMYYAELGKPYNAPSAEGIKPQGDEMA